MNNLIIRSYSYRFFLKFNHNINLKSKLLSQSSTPTMSTFYLLINTTINFYVCLVSFPCSRYKIKLILNIAPFYFRSYLLQFLTIFSKLVYNYDIHSCSFLRKSNISAFWPICQKYLVFFNFW